MKNLSKAVIEILSLQLKQGHGKIFDSLYKELSVPMLLRWNVDLLAYGPSLHDNDFYIVIRRYKGIEDRQFSQDAFYGSSEWKNGPREIILSHIENYTAVVVAENSLLLNGIMAIGNLDHPSVNNERKEAM
ncbi:MAG: NIPSNAP family protein [Bacteroidetes bacterium]|nr:NIPSNAP family protein [Bacteroidota bacterium]